MTKQECTAVRAWLRQHATDSQGPPAQIVAHVEQCPTCQGALLLLGAAALFDQPPAAISCQMCQDDLPGYLEYAAQMGPREAARVYPHVWLHLWTCPDCAELAEMAQLAMEEAVIELPRPFSVLMRLPHSFLMLALPGPQLGVPRSGQAIEEVIAEEEQGGRQISLSAGGPAKGLWHLTVWVSPPPAGHVLLICGDTRLRAALGSDGSAAFAVPVELLSAPDGPDVELLLEEEAA
ncbi:MAG: hypothetical protein OHK0022_48060 [Roseiflexaceae bacterium]